MSSITFQTHRKPSPWEQHQPQKLLNRLKEAVRVRKLSSMPASERWLLCRPQGGLNDSLCQIHKCLLYATLVHRNVVIDTTQAGFCDDFSNYFEPIQPAACLQTRLTPEMLTALDALPCRPKSLEHKLRSYEIRYAPEICSYVESITGERIGITWNDKDYPEDLIVHDQCGGGIGCHAFVYFRFAKDVRDEIAKRLAKLPSNYTSLVIRHSDVKLDYKSFLSSLKHKLSGCHLLVSTDSYEALNYARSFLDESVVYDVANVPDVQGKTLLNTPGVTSRSIIIGCLAQLIALARAREINIPDGPEVYPSGFTQLAMSLSCRDDLIRQLLHLPRLPVPGLPAVHPKSS